MILYSVFAIQSVIANDKLLLIPASIRHWSEVGG
jgi:hypothetical protein